MPAATGLLNRSADAGNNPARHTTGYHDARKHGHRLTRGNDPDHNHNKDTDTRQDTDRYASRTGTSYAGTGFLSLHGRFLRDAHYQVIV